MTAVLMIGGTDSSGGAGLTRDTAVAHALGCAVLPIVTAVTAQTHDTLRDAQPLPAEFVARQIRAALASERPAAIKIGMLGSRDIADAVACELRSLDCPLVIDPVLRSSSGGALMSGGLPDMLLSQATLITPNLPEAAALTERPPATSTAEILTQAQWFLSKGAGAVLVKGGHADGAQAVDHLVTTTELNALTAPRLRATARGTGCALASGIACGLAQGRSLYQACAEAKTLVLDRLRRVAQV